MSNTDVKRVGTALKDAVDAVTQEADRLHSKVNELKQKTLDKFHQVDGVCSDWEEGLSDLDDFLNTKSNNPPKDGTPE